MILSAIAASVSQKAILSNPDTTAQIYFRDASHN